MREYEFAIDISEMYGVPADHESVLRVAAGAEKAAEEIGLYWCIYPVGGGQLRIKSGIKISARCPRRKLNAIMAEKAKAIKPLLIVPRGFRFEGLRPCF